MYYREREREREKEGERAREKHRESEGETQRERRDAALRSEMSRASAQQRADREELEAAKHAEQVR